MFQLCFTSLFQCVVVLALRGSFLIVIVCFISFLFSFNLCDPFLLMLNLAKTCVVDLSSRRAVGQSWAKGWPNLSSHALNCRLGSM